VTPFELEQTVKISWS